MKKWAQRGGRIEESLQLLCQRKLEDKNSPKFTVQNTQYLGSGLFACAECGGILLGRTKSGKEPKLRYMCASRYNKAGCDAPMVKAEFLRHGLDQIVRMFLSRPENVERVAKRAAEMVKARRVQPPGERGGGQGAAAGTWPAEGEPYSQPEGGAVTWGGQ